MRTTFRIFLAACACSALPSTHAQFFIEAHGSYLGRIGGYTFSNFDEPTNNVTREVYNLGEGVAGGLVLGFGCSDMWGTEVRMTYVSGRKLETESSVSISGSQKSTETYKTNHLRIEPAVRLTVGAGNAKVYAAAGPSFAFAPKFTFEYESNTTYTNSSFPGMPLSEQSTGTYEATGGLGLGGFGAVGFLYQGEGALGFFVELSATAQSWAPTEGKFTSESRTQYVGGTSSSDSESETVDYVDEYDLDEDNKSLKDQLPMSTWGLRVGLHVRFGGSE